MTFREKLVAAGNLARLAIYDAASAADRSAMEAFTDELWQPLEAAYGEAEQASRAARLAEVAAAAARTAPAAAPVAGGPLPTAAPEARNTTPAAGEYGLEFRSHTTRAVEAPAVNVSRNTATAVASIIRGRALGYAAGEGGGENLVPTEFSQNVIDIAAADTPFLNENVTFLYPMTRDQADVPIIVSDAAPSGTAWAQNQNAPSSTEPVFGTVRLNANYFGGLIPIGDDLVKDSPLAVTQLVARSAGRGIAKLVENQMFSTVGVSTAAPQGLFDPANGIERIAFDDTPAPGLVSDVVVGNFQRGYVLGLRDSVEIASDASAGFTKRQTLVRYGIRLDGKIAQASAIKVGTNMPIVGGDDVAVANWLEDLVNALPTEDLANANIFVSRAAYSRISKLRGTDGHKLLTRDPQERVARILGVPVYRTSGFGTRTIAG